MLRLGLAVRDKQEDIKLEYDVTRSACRARLLGTPVDWYVLVSFPR